MKKLILAALLFLIFLPAAVSAAWILFQPVFLKNLERDFVAATAAEVRLGDIRFRYSWPPSVEFQGLTLREPEDKDLLFSAASLTASIDWKSLLKMRPVWKKLSFDQGEFYFSRDRGAWNNLDFLTSSRSLLFFPPAESWEFLGTSLIFNESLQGAENFEIRLRDTQALLLRREKEEVIDFDIFGMAARRDGEDRDFVLSGTYFPSEDRLDGLFSLDQERWMLEGTLYEISRTPHFEGSLDSAGQSVSGLLRAWGMTREMLEGQGIFHGEGRLRGLTPQIIHEMLMMQGSLDIRDGRLLNVNPVRQSIEEALRAVNAGAFQTEDFKQSAFAPLFLPGALEFEFFQSDVEVFQERVFFRETILKHSQYVLEADGQYGWETQELDFQGKLVLLEPLSAALTEKYPALKIFLNSRGRMVFPVIYRGLLQEPVFRLDDRYLNALLSTEADS